MKLKNTCGQILVLLMLVVFGSVSFAALSPEVYQKKCFKRLSPNCHSYAATFCGRFANAIETSNKAGRDMHNERSKLCNQAHNDNLNAYNDYFCGADVQQEKLACIHRN